MANQSCRTKISPSSVPTHLVHSVHVTSAKRGEQRAATPQRELAAPICMFTKDPSGSPLERLQEKGDRIWTPPPTPPRGGRQGQGHSGKATLRHKGLRHRIGGENQECSWAIGRGTRGPFLTGCAQWLGAASIPQVTLCQRPC